MPPGASWRIGGLDREERARLTRVRRGDDLRKGNAVAERLRPKNAEELLDAVKWTAAEA